MRDNSIYDNNGHKLIISPNLQEILNEFTSQKKMEILGKYFSKVRINIDHDSENNLHILKEHRLLVGGGPIISKILKELLKKPRPRPRPPYYK